MLTNLRSSVQVAVVAMLTCGAFACGVPTTDAQQVPALDNPKSENTPAAPESPARARIEAALEAARAELADVEEKIAAEARAEQAQIEELNDAVSALLVEDTRIQDELRKAFERLQNLEFEIDDAERAAGQLKDQKGAAASEIRSQASSLKERFERSLFGLERPDLIERAGALANEMDASPREMIDTLLQLYSEVLDNAGTVSTFRHNIRLSGTEGKVEGVDVLRMGFLSGFYRHPTSGETGFVSIDPDSGALSGSNEGLSEQQALSMGSIVSNPATGGTLAVDVTGGAGIASLQAKDSLRDWFEKGGVFMWALVAVAVFAALLIIERAIVLTLRSMGIKRKINRIVRLVEAGDIDRATLQTERMGGAVGSVLHAALIHADKDRSVMEDAVQEALLHATPKYQARLGFIALCAAISPLMGLLGTVTGMITTFKMVTIFGTSDPRFMAGGISEALITTQGGLYLAIPCLMFRGALGAVAESALDRLEAGGMSVVLALLEHQAETRDQELQPQPIAESVTLELASETSPTPTPAAAATVSANGDGEDSTSAFRFSTDGDRVAPAGTRFAISSAESVASAEEHGEEKEG